MEPLIAVLLGSLLGLVTGVLPGLHVNTLAALGATWAVVPELGLGLIAVGTVHTFVSIIPATYLGAPSDDTALGILPAHQMLRNGRAPEAIRISLIASTWALLLAVLLLVPYRWLLIEPGRALPWLQAHTAVLLSFVVGWLLFLEWRQRPAKLPAAMLVTAIAGALGALAFEWPTRNLVGAPTSPLLPLLTGLFAVPTLLASLDGGSLPIQDAPPQAPAIRGVGRGTLLCALSAVLPGVTAATATAIATRPTDDPRPIIATLSAVNTAHLVFALALLWIADIPRSGLARAVMPLGTPWSMGPPTTLYWVVATLLVAGILGAVGTLLLEPWFRRTTRIPVRTLHGSVLMLLCLLSVGLAGVWGFALLVVASVVGRLPLVLGVRRVHLAACLTIPIIL